MKGPVMHTPASLASRLWGRWLLVLGALAMLAGPAISTPAEARAKSKAKQTRELKKSKPKAAAKRQPGKRSKPRHAKRSAPRRSNPAKLVMPAVEPSPVLDVAAQYLGRPYRFGSSSGAYDCSGFVRRVFEAVGVDLPRSARDQFARGELVGRDELSAGDLVFFRTYRRGASHVGIYVGDDKFIHAARRGGQIQVDSLSQRYYSSRYLGARRIEAAS